MLITPGALVGNIGFVLDHEVAPAVSDQPWLASYLRSISSLLPYLGALIEFEGPMLQADNVDARRTLGAVAAAGVATDGIHDVLARFDPGPAVLTMADLRAEHAAYQSQLDQALPLLHEPGREALLDDVRAYLSRNLERKQPIYGALGPIPF